MWRPYRGTPWWCFGRQSNGSKPRPRYPRTAESCFVGVRRGEPKGPWQPTAFDDGLLDRRVKPINSKSYRPQTSGKPERFHRYAVVDLSLQGSAQVCQVLQREKAVPFTGHRQLCDPTQSAFRQEGSRSDQKKRAKAGGDRPQLLVDVISIYCTYQTKTNNLIYRTKPTSINDPLSIADLVSAPVLSVGALLLMLVESNGGEEKQTVSCN